MTEKNSTSSITPIASENAAAAELIQSINASQISDAIKAVGCAVTAIEQDGVVRLHSASHGVGFQVLWGNEVSPGQYADLTLSCPLRVQGGILPEGVLSSWHRSKRFARVAQHGDFVVLEMDMIAAGGVSPAHLVLTMHLWTQMMGQFFLHLRNYSASDEALQAAAADREATAALPATSKPVAAEMAE
ncbi:YbjN domain-containing protein [Variovorax sp. HJSM1_2]|uniref:YbjN domain-containing protein n=1 Tax=Variovorax sp. HJSM1_2 TaxID=3366263 RepID=UPI003BE1A2A4